MRCIGKLSTFFVVVAPLTLAHPGIRAAEIRVQLAPAWQGYLRTDHGSEIAVRVWDEAERTVDVELQSSGTISHVTLKTLPETANTVFVPIPPASSTDVSLRIRDHVSGEQLHEAPVTTVSAPPQLVAVAPPSLLTALTKLPIDHHRAVVAIAPDSLPHTSQGYDAISMLVLDAQVLRQLDRQQLEALQRHLALCGRTVFVGLPAAALPRLRQASGCAGAAVSTPAKSGSLAEIVAHLLSQPTKVSARMDAATLLIDQHEPSAITEELVAALCVYAVALLLLIGFGAVSWAIVGISVLALSAILCYGQLRPPAVTSSYWLEMSDRNTVGSYIGVYRIRAAGPDDVVIPVASDALVLSKPVSGGMPLRISRTPRQQLVTLTTSLSAPPPLEVRGAFAFRPPVVAEWRTGHLVLRNNSSTSTPAGYFIDAKGVAQPLPALTPGNLFQPEEARTSPIKLPAALGDFHAADRGPMALLPISTQFPGPQVVSSASQGWLLIRYKAGE